MRVFFNMLAAKQNQKFPFHFLSAPPTPPAEENKEGKENFWFLLLRPKGADEARITHHQGSIQNTFELRPIHTAGTKNSRVLFGRIRNPSPVFTNDSYHE